MDKEPNSQPNKSDKTEFINMSDDELIQYAIDMDGGLYDQAQELDASETASAEKSLQDKAYDTYVENIKITKQREHQESQERINRVSKRALKGLGSAALKEILPFATEIIQRHNSHNRMKYRRSDLMPKKPDLDKSMSEVHKFTGSVEDFMKIRKAKYEDQKQKNISRRARRQAFFE